ncbi:MAG: Na+-transporting NADH:ubiquinone oxidoreductase subunit A [Candidatus Azotimanducaceae bacterium]|jgi:Na+-transporting NADH:ubiquinone oxidoreductase subunit A
MIKTKKGLDLPIAGGPEQIIDAGRPARSVALVGFDYHGLKPTMAVAEGDQVVLGQLLFTDKKSAGIKYTAPASGTITAIHRGAKRVFQSLVIDIDSAAETSQPPGFTSYTIADIAALDREKVVTQLVDSGEWTALRNRPFNRVPAIDSMPHSLFVTAIDTRPLCADPQLVIAEQAEAFSVGLDVLAKLTTGPVYVCQAAGANLPVANDARVQVEEFAGPHPAGLVGTHIHFLAPVSENRTVWHIGYQDVIAIGHLFLTGQIYTQRVVAMAGPGVSQPRLVRTRRGASIIEMTAGELEGANPRVISGSVFDGRTAVAGVAYLGRFHQQVSVLEEGTQREFLGYLTIGSQKFTLTRLYLAAWRKTKMKFTTSTGGSERAMVPMGTFEKVMPLDILPTQLLRALLVKDVDTAILLGCLELDEEDLALCTFACPGKYEYGPYLRDMLTQIETEG